MTTTDAALFPEPPRAPEPPQLPHVLVARYSPDGDGMDYTLECPGVSDRCRCWDECVTCYQETPSGMTIQTRELLEDCGEAHGEDHAHIDGVWMTRSVPARCYAADHDGLPDTADDLARAPGRYPVDLDFGDGTELYLHPITTPAEATR